LDRPSHFHTGYNFPTIISQPPGPETDVWPYQVTELHALLHHLIASYKVDTTRVYLTGLSMGGYGTWYFASEYPERFAAIAPICGGGGWWMPRRLTSLPIWVFHGDADTTVPLRASEEMVKAIREAGGKVKFTVYPGVGHDSWTETYNNPELYNWFLSHSR